MTPNIDRIVGAGGGGIALLSGLLVWVSTGATPAGLAVSFLAALVAAIACFLSGRVFRRKLNRLASAMAATKPAPVDGSMPLPELKMLEAAWESARARMEQVFSSQKDFTANAAHELRTPLTALRLEGESILRRPEASAEELVQSVGSMLEETRRVSQLVDRLLMLARAESGRIPVRAEYLQAGEVVRDVYEMLLPLAEDRGHKLHFEDDSSPTCWADLNLLRLAVENLAANAIEHNRNGVRIDLRVERRPGSGITIEIADDGRGIRAEDATRVFHRFYRGREGESRGSGLGLPIARWAVEAFGGRLELLQTPGSGTRFRIFCPETEWDYCGKADASQRQSWDQTPELEWVAASEPGQLLARLGTGRHGLDHEEARRRRQRAGRNRFEEQRLHSPWKHLWRAIKSPFNGILALCLSLSLFLGEWQPAWIMGAMIVLSTSLRYWQERKSMLAIEALEDLVAVAAQVSRPGAGRASRVQIEDLVPGDVIHLSPGDMVPADLRLISAHGLQVSEATLTGESYPVPKTAHSVHAGDAGEQATPDNLCFLGTHVVGGGGIGVVYATGRNTRLGRTAIPLRRRSPVTAFEIGVRQVSFLLLGFMGGLFAVVLLINGLFRGDWPEALLFSLAVAIGLTPELLPMMVNVNLARASRLLATKGLIIKNLAAVHSFGAMDLLCIDKTGTLTTNVPRFLGIETVRESPAERALLLACLNARFQGSRRSNLDAALLQAASRGLPDSMLEPWRRCDELPFDYERRRVSIIAEQSADEGRHLICKGAPENILEICSTVRVGQEITAWTPDLRREVEEQLQRYLQEGQRVLGLASKVVDRTRSEYTLQDEKDLCFEGFLLFQDPLKPGVRRTLSLLQESGVDVKILTGDHPRPALAAARQAGLDTGEATLTGADMAQLDDDALLERAAPIKVFARLSPADKARLVRLFRSRGQRVGFLGEGANDANALREADVGFATENSAPLAKECAEVIVTGKDLAVLHEGIQAGRQSFGNILKYIKITASSNFGNAFSMVLASLILPFLPMRAVQILAQNLLYDLAQFLLPWDRVDAEFTRRPKPWSADSIGRFMLVFGPLSSIFDILTFAVLWYGFGASDIENQALFQTGWFIVGLLTQIMIIHILRTGQIPFIQSRATTPVVLAGLAVSIIGVALPFTLLGPWFGFTAIPLAYFWWVAVVLVAYAASAHWIKRLYIRRTGQWL